MTDTKTSTAKRNCDGQPSLAPATCSVAAMNNTDVIITSTMLTIEHRNNPDNQMSAVLTKEQAARIIKALSEWHKIEPPNDGR
jgi:hypothetical protein